MILRQKVAIVLIKCIKTSHVYFVRQCAVFSALSSPHEHFSILLISEFTISGWFLYGLIIAAQLSMPMLVLTIIALVQIHVTTA